MKKFLFPLLVFSLFVVGCSEEKYKVPPLFPEPNTISVQEGGLEIPQNISIYFSDRTLKKRFDAFKDQTISPISFEVSSKENALIETNVNQGLFMSAEGYWLEVKKGKILVTGKTDKGLLYGLRTVEQLISNCKPTDGKKILPYLTISDEPRFRWRGFMLDESRHFMGEKQVMQLLDWMSYLKLNKFHWHLTDVDGWRIEIKKYPLLTTIGGKGNKTDPSAPAQFYTQEQIKKIVDYAHDKGIDVIPEIDMPGHASAAIRAYPSLGCDKRNSPQNHTFNAGKKSTYEFLDDVLNEVKILFPSPYIHLGGDEVALNGGYSDWKHDRSVARLMKENNLLNMKEVENYFVRRMADSINSKNRITVGWDEILKAKCNRSKTLIMWWRHDKPELLKEALDSNQMVVLCPRIPLYFDFVQDSVHTKGRKWGKEYSDIEKVYNFPSDTLYKKKSKNMVLGIQANLWSETVISKERMQFMTFPRIFALSEAAWSFDQNKDWNHFKNKSKDMNAILERNGISYYNFLSPSSSKEILE